MERMKIIDLIKSRDQKVSRTIENNQIPFFNQFFGSITSLGSAYFSFILIGFLWSFDQTIIASKISIGLVANGLAIFSLKFISGRKRPQKHIENLFSNASFTSGHSANAFMNATILSAYLDRALGFLTLAALIALSRVYLEDHYPSDIITGSVIGAVIGQILITV
jgi:undecaprenyl-diphosphatase